MPKPESEPEKPNSPRDASTASGGYAGRTWQGGPRQRVRRLPLVVLLVLVAAGWWFWEMLSARALTATSVAARVACSCHHVGGRDLGDCRKDFEPGMGPVSLSADDDAKSVTARYLLFAGQTATYRSGEGCLLERWQD
ncbi:MAG: hypothetical protein WCY11_10760 [Novosphingobium sp.]